MHNKYMSKQQYVKVYAIFDNKAETFKAPFLMVNDAVAVRAFTEYVNDPKSEIYKYPEDYDLYYLSVINLLDGKFASNEPQKITNGANVKTQDNAQQ